MGGYIVWSGLCGGFGFNFSFIEIFLDSMFICYDMLGLLDVFVGGGSVFMLNYYYIYDFDEVVVC